MLRGLVTKNATYFWPAMESVHYDIMRQYPGLMDQETIKNGEDEGTPNCARVFFVSKDDGFNFITKHASDKIIIDSSAYCNALMNLPDVTTVFGGII